MGKLKKKKYRVEGIFWVPSYRDFDCYDYTVRAYSLKQAKFLAKLDTMYQFAKRKPAVTEIVDNLAFMDSMSLQEIDDFVDGRIELEAEVKRGR